MENKSNIEEFLYTFSTTLLLIYPSILICDVYFFSISKNKSHNYLEMKTFLESQVKFIGWKCNKNETLSMILLAPKDVPIYMYIYCTISVSLYLRKRIFSRTLTNCFVRQLRFEKRICPNKCLKMRVTIYM